jgi:hypothetical protein
MMKPYESLTSICPRFVLVCVVLGICAHARSASADAITYTYAGQPLISGFTGEFDGTGYVSGFITLDYAGAGTYTSLMDWSMTYNQGEQSFTLDSANSITETVEFVTDPSGEFLTRWNFNLLSISEDPRLQLLTYYPDIAGSPGYAKEIVSSRPLGYQSATSSAINNENSPNRPTQSTWTIQTPEPGSLALLGVGALALRFARRRRTNSLN